MHHLWYSKNDYLCTDRLVTSGRQWLWRGISSFLSVCQDFFDIPDFFWAEQSEGWKICLFNNEQEENENEHEIRMGWNISQQDIK